MIFMKMDFQAACTGNKDHVRRMARIFAKLPDLVQIIGVVGGVWHSSLWVLAKRGKNQSQATQ